MKSILTGALILLLVPAAYAEDPRLETSRDIVASFQKQLGGRLISAIKSGGPVEAIKVCRDEAPGIAAQMSGQSGAEVGRTAIRVRNPDNAASEIQLSIMQGFERDAASGSAKAPEHFEVAADGSARYMKAIVMQQKCLACHGAKLAPEIKTSISESYPADQATGFEEGDLRGAFVIEWPSGT